jgi:anti-anti-sigma factor
MAIKNSNYSHMKVKIDTKEKFKVIRPEEPELTANMTENLREIFQNCLTDYPHNVILNLSAVTSVSEEAANLLTDIQQHFYENQYSFVLCELKEDVEEALDQMGLLELLNTTPTESEAWDIVQMEEIERELLGDDDMENNDK